MRVLDFFKKKWDKRFLKEKSLFGFQPEFSRIFFSKKLKNFGWTLLQKKGIEKLTDEYGKGLDRELDGEKKLFWSKKWEKVVLKQKKQLILFIFERIREIVVNW